jgi:hypothetical protein
MPLAAWCTGSRSSMIIDTASHAYAARMNLTLRSATGGRCQSRSGAATIHEPAASMIHGIMSTAAIACFPLWR